MRKVKRWRYYCDFCKKVNGSVSVMKKHETGCTNNPNRVCGICKIMNLAQRPMTALTASLTGGFGSLRHEAENCPACILATLRQNPFELGIKHEKNGNMIMDGREDFDFKTEMASMWKDVNASREPTGPWDC